MLPILLITATAAFIPAPPTPAECEVALREYCGVDKGHNATACRKCVATHASELSAKGCTSTQEEAYCAAPMPPGGACLADLERYCGVDRHEPTECATCVKDHASELGKANCTEATERAFCEGPPKPPAPNAECAAILQEECGVDKKNRTLCVECLERHHNQTMKANCSYTQMEEFCHPVTPPSTECLRVMFEDCGKVRYNRTECKACEEKNAEAFKEAKCTEEQIEDFCEPPRPPPPAPNSTCKSELVVLCGKEAHNRTTCFHCVEEHNVTLKAHGCTLRDIDAFCDVTPPPTSCDTVLEELCAEDRRNKTLCASCIRRHANETERAHCTTAEEEAFCNPPAPPAPPGYTCREELEHYCGADRGNVKLCDACVAEHASELQKAKCNAAYEHQFCNGAPAPPPPTEKCEQVLNADCGAEKADHTKCIECLAEHHNATREAGCSYAQMEQFCGAPSEECEHVLLELCGEDRHNKTKCGECEREHAANLTAAHCTATQEEEFCSAPPSPTPGGTCLPSLEALCDHERTNRTLCVHCVEEHKSILDGKNCTYKDIDAFCHITPPEPDNCMAELDRYCGVDRHNRTLCLSCEERHANYTKSCTPAEKMDFCASRPAPPITQCTKVLDSYCAIDRANHTKCIQCTADHEGAEKAAGCTADEISKFCERAPPAPPSPGAKCIAALKNFCGMDTDKHACIECTVSHAAALKAADCTESEETVFCNNV